MFPLASGEAELVIDSKVGIRGRLIPGPQLVRLPSSPGAQPRHFPNVGLACASTLDATVPRDKNDIDAREERRRRFCPGRLFATGFGGAQPRKFY